MSAGTRAARWPAALFALLALVAAAAHAGLLPRELARAATAPLLLAGAAFPLVLAWSPREPSALKVSLYACLLSPLVAGALAEGLALLFGAAAAWPGALVLLAAFQLLALRAPLKLERLGAAAWVAVAASVLGAAAVLAATLALGGGLRFTTPAGLWHAGIVQALARGWPLENPWLAETLPGTHLGYDRLVLWFARGLALAPPAAMAVIGAWSALCLPLALYLLAAPLWRDAPRVLLALGLGLAGWSASTGWAALLSAGGREPDAARHPLVAWMEPGELGPALAFLAAGWVAAAHALRHGRRPWVGLAALMHAAAALVEPRIGLAASFATLAAATLASRVAPRVLLAFLPGTALALWAVAAQGPAADPWPRPLAGPRIELGLASLAALAAASAGLALASWRVAEGDEQARGRRTILALVLAQAGLAPAIALLAPGPSAGALLVGRAASMALGILAAGGLFELARAGGRRRLGAGFLALMLVGGSLASLVLGLPPDLARAREPVPLAERDGTIGMVPRGPDRREADLARAYRWLRADLPLRAERPILVRSIQPPLLELAAPFGPQIAPLVADLPLWFDAEGPHVAHHPRWRERFELVGRLYRDRGRDEPWSDWDPRVALALERSGRPAIFLVEELDRVATRGAIERRLAAIGCERLRAFGEVALWVRWPRREGLPR